MVSNLQNKIENVLTRVAHTQIACDGKSCFATRRSQIAAHDTTQVES